MKALVKLIWIKKISCFNQMFTYILTQILIFNETLDIQLQSEQFKFQFQNKVRFLKNFNVGLMQRDLISSSKQTKNYFTNTIWHPGNTKNSISIILVLSLLKALDSSSSITLIPDLIYCKFSLQYCLKEEVSYFSYQCISSSTHPFTECFINFKNDLT